MKYCAYTTDPEGFIDGYSNSFFLLDSTATAPSEWVYIADVELNIESIDMNRVRAGAIQGVEKKMADKRRDYTAGMEELSERCEELLAFTHQPDHSDG